MERIGSLVRISLMLPALALASGCDELRSAVRVIGASPADATRGTHDANWVMFEGACDASGAVPLDERHFAVADDEDNVLRVYDAELGGPPRFQVDVTEELDLQTQRRKKKRKKPKRKAKAAESDIEAATLLGSHAYWLTSHGRTKKGKHDRFRFFATELPQEGHDLRMLGAPARDLIDDMLKDPRLKELGLEAASELAPKDPGGLNLEGMTATFDDALFIGFRNPIPEERAIVVRIENPRQVMAGDAARFGALSRLDLGGRGVRGLSTWRGSYLILAGSFDGSGRSALYLWDGSGAPRLERNADFDDFNPEGFFTPEVRNKILVLSDDGDRAIDGNRCKSLKDPGAKRFRGLWLELSGPPA